MEINPHPGRVNYYLHQINDGQLSWNLCLLLNRSHCIAPLFPRFYKKGSKSESHCQVCTKCAAHLNPSHMLIKYHRRPRSLVLYFMWWSPAQMNYTGHWLWKIQQKAHVKPEMNPVTSTSQDLLFKVSLFCDLFPANRTCQSQLSHLASLLLRKKKPTMTKSNVERKGLFQFITVRSYSITEGCQGWNSRKDSRGRNRNTNKVEMLAAYWFAPMVCSACFSIIPRTIWQGVVLPPVIWALPNQSLIYHFIFVKMPYRLFYNPTLFSFFFQMRIPFPKWL